MRRYKYPRTYHFPWSQGVTSDDKVLSDVSSFIGKEIIITEKMDGECSALYSDGFTHARSIDSNAHPSRDWLKRFWADKHYLLPNGWRIYAENAYATHSIHYTNLKSYVLGFSLWDENVCKSWDETLMWFDELGIQSVPVIYRGMYDESVLHALVDKMDMTTQEGYVVRIVDSFSVDFDSIHKNEQFSKFIAKFVRKNHVQTDQHWSQKPIVPNELEIDYANAFNLTYRKFL